MSVITDVDRFAVCIPFLSDYGHRERVFNWVMNRWKAHFPKAEYSVVGNFKEPFSRGEARNDAVRSTRSDVVVIADADTTYADPGQIRQAVGQVKDNPNAWVIPYAEEHYYNLAQDATEFLLSIDPGTALKDPDNEDAWEHKITSWAGILVMHRAAFEAAGGYDRRFIGWGYEDNAFQLCLDTIVARHQRIEAPVFHLWHPISAQTNFDQPYIQHNRDLYRRYVTAFGNAERMRELTQR